MAAQFRLSGNNASSNSINFCIIGLFHLFWRYSANWPVFCRPSRLKKPRRPDVQTFLSQKAAKKKLEKASPAGLAGWTGQSGLSAGLAGWAC
jgi:hypothetical protein